ncbi:MAG: Lrp/AsnC family transcriptional regulator [Candidatus Thermoplasmatota archaeon]|nr:Lrp/AsnC family transcriptional regulator [Candidatus Thermoplasmatota archaeon]
MVISKEQEIENIRKVAYLLRDNARITTEEIAQQTKLTRQTVSKIIRNLEKTNAIWGYSTFFDPEKIGLRIFIILAKSKRNIDIELIKKSIRETTKTQEKIGVIHAGYFTGHYDLIILYYAESVSRATKVMNIWKKQLDFVLEDVVLQQELFPITQGGVRNPDLIKKIDDVF